MRTTSTSSTSCSNDLDLTKAARKVRKQAVRLARLLGVTRQLVRALTALRRALQCGGQVKKRRGKPATFQVLENPELHPFAQQKP